MTVVDAHLHLWDLTTGEYGWNTSALGAAHADFGVPEARVALAASGAARAVLVQAADTVDDSERLLDIVRQERWAAGVVAWAPFDDAAAAAALVDRWSADDGVVGLRALVHVDPRDDLLAGEDARRTAARAAVGGLVLDIPDAWPRLWPAVLDLVDAVPDLDVVLDHLGKPGPRGDGDEDWFEAWRRDLADLARRPSVVVKASGLGAARRAVAALGHAPDVLVDVAVEAFGADRVMVGSDWPMVLAEPDVDAAADAPGGARPLADGLPAGSSGVELDALLGGTATRVYGLAP